VTCRRRRGDECRAPHPRRSPPPLSLLSSPRSARVSGLLGQGDAAGSCGRLCACASLIHCVRGADQPSRPYLSSRAGRGGTGQLGGPRVILRSGERSQRQPCGTREIVALPRAALLVHHIVCVETFTLPYLTFSTHGTKEQRRVSPHKHAWNGQDRERQRHKTPRQRQLASRTMVCESSNSAGDSVWHPGATSLANPSSSSARRARRGDDVLLRGRPSRRPCRPPAEQRPGRSAVVDGDL